MRCWYCGHDAERSADDRCRRCGRGSRKRVDQDLVSEVIDGIEIIPIGKLLDATYGEALPSYEQQIVDTKAFVAAHDVTFYGAPRESFFMFKAVEQAKAEGRLAVIVEDLS